MRALQRFADWDAASSRRLSLAGRPGPLRSLAVFFAHSGDSWFWLVGLGIVWLAGTPYWKARALLYALSILVTAVLVLGVKFSVRRRRPEGEWGAVYRKTDPHSFPSGHAARAVLLAVLALGTGPAWLGLLLAIWAPLVILARVAMGVHYLSDVIAGALFGALIGILILAVAPVV